MLLPEIHTSRLLMRPWCEEDIDALHQILADPEVRRYLCDDVVLSRERVASMVRRNLDAASTHGAAVWCLCLGGTTRLVGFCGFFLSEGKDDLELLYALLPEYWGRGLATEAARAALNYFWRNTKFDFVCARADPPNVKSFEVMRRLGMQEHSRDSSLITYVAQRPKMESS